MTKKKEIHDKHQQLHDNNEQLNNTSNQTHDLIYWNKPQSCRGRGNYFREVQAKPQALPELII